MKILFIANHLNVGGITSYLLTLAGGLKEKGHRVYLASSGGEMENKFVQAGIILLKAPLKTKSEISPKIFLSFWKLKRMIQQYNIDLIHSHSRTTQVLGAWLGRSLGKPHLFTCHGFFRPKLFRKIFGCWGQKIIAISQQVKEHLVTDFELPADKIIVINNGIDTNNFGDFSARVNMRRDLGAKNDFLVGIIARLSDVKGHIYLIRAMREVVKKIPNTKLLIVGQGKTKGVLIKETRDLGLMGHIIFIPEAKNTKDLLAAMDVFVMPSLQEGLGLALMEAMAQGVAPVGSAVGGIKTLIQDKVNGLLVAPADAAALAQAIILLFGDPQLRGDLGSHAREFIINNFSKEKMVRETQGVYQELLEGVITGEPK
ncbi:MAG: glycosyltransferase family 4 protein [Candidatus Omnitrophica bacterium]|nr:glycosyltransferase family 4 protein [Candidatus Omnitrophota bacterium]